jgi:inner membrane transporter RhtA
MDEDGLTPPSRRAWTSSVVLPLLAVTCAMACFQIGAALAKGLFPRVGPQGAAALRLCLGAAMLLALGRPWRRWPRPAPLAGLIGLGVSMAAAIVFFYLAIQRLPLGIAITLQFLGPLGVALAGSRRLNDLLWVALAAGGVWALVGAGAGSVRISPIGVAFALSAAAGWAGYILCGKAAGRVYGGSTAPLAAGMAALLVLPFGLASAGPALVSPALLPLAALVALVSTALPFTLELYALPRLPARTFAIFTSLEPVFAGLSGLVFLGERLSATQWCGIALVVTAAGGAAWSSVRAQDGPPLPGSE